MLALTTNAPNPLKSGRFTYKPNWENTWAPLAAFNYEHLNWKSEKIKLYMLVSILYIISLSYIKTTLNLSRSVYPLYTRQTPSTKAPPTLCRNTNSSTLRPSHNRTQINPPPRRKTRHHDRQPRQSNRHRKHPMQSRQITQQNPRHILCGEHIPNLRRPRHDNLRGIDLRRISRQAPYQGILKRGLARRDEETPADRLHEEQHGGDGGNVREGDAGLDDDDGDLEAET